MAATATLTTTTGRSAAGTRYLREGTLNLGTYATGGIAVTKATFDLWHSLVDLEVRPSGGYVPEYVGGKVKVYDQKDPAASGGADIPLPEVANATDLSAVNFPFRAEGH